MFSNSKYCTRPLLWGLNLIFLIAGLGLIGCGCFVYFHEVADWAGKEVSYFLWGLGFFVSMLSLVALVGARSQTNYYLLRLYAALLTGLIILQVVFVVFMLTMDSTAKSLLLRQWMRLSADQRDEIMERAECGIHSSDWPSDKCADDGSDCFDDCYDFFVEELTSVGSVVMIVGVAVAALELVLLCSTFVVICVDDEVDQSHYASHHDHSAGGGGGYYQTERYCGGLSWVIGCTILPCICCCPIDERRTWVDPSSANPFRSRIQV